MVYSQMCMENALSNDLAIFDRTYAKRVAFHNLKDNGNENFYWLFQSYLTT
jgi:hypothetical protein